MLLTNIVGELDKSKFEQYIDQLLDWIMGKAFDVFIAFLFIFLGMKLSKLIVKILKRSFTKSGMETSVSGFLISLVKGILYMVVFIMGAAIMGFQVTSLVAILGTAGLAIGLSLQGSLSNFAGGVLILIMKPFKVGDYIVQNLNGCEGIVTSIDIFYTKLKTIDNKVIVIPNGNIMAGTVTNVTALPVRRLDIIVNIAYDSDIKLAKKILNDIATNSSYYKKDQEITVFVDELGEYSVAMGLRFYVDTDKYWNAKWDTLETIKSEFSANNIKIPYRHMDVLVSNKE